MFFVYILRSLKNGSFYKEFSDNVYRRLDEHNSGKNKSTARYTPWELVWFCKKETRREALILEKKLKNITSRNRIEDFLKRNLNSTAGMA